VAVEVEPRRQAAHFPTLYEDGQIRPDDEAVGLVSSPKLIEANVVPAGLDALTRAQRDVARRLERGGRRDPDRHRDHAEMGAVAAVATAGRVDQAAQGHEVGLAVGSHARPGATRHTA